LDIARRLTKKQFLKTVPAVLPQGLFLWLRG
jgi:hypothetical protein